MYFTLGSNPRASLSASLDILCRILQISIEFG